jgi:hypothetical protein|tara:strand:+ start:30 stop:308 length:279 start_codon:yes stop_codon:yes gene_type:complete
MKLININKNGTLKFQLKTGKHVYSYNSGYVRIEGNDRLYQINRVRKIEGNCTYLNYYERILIPNPQERFNYLVSWVERYYKRNNINLIDIEL